MRYVALAMDYDGTLACDGHVTDEALAALTRFVASGRRLVLVTGRQLDDLQHVFPRLDLFQRVVAENGAVLYSPQSRELRVLASPPPPALLEALRARHVEPIAVGKVVVATREPHQAAALDAIRSLGLEMHLEFNRGAVMLLPAEVTKRTGLAAALDELQISLHDVVGIGDGENDRAFLATCECAVSVANAIESLRQRTDWTTAEPCGRGVVELIERVLANDLRGLPA